MFVNVTFDSLIELIQERTATKDARLMACRDVYACVYTSARGETADAKQNTYLLPEGITNGLGERAEGGLAGTPTVPRSLRSQGTVLLQNTMVMR